jgi:hypothetical protein
MFLSLPIFSSTYHTRSLVSPRTTDIRVKQRLISTLISIPNPPLIGTARAVSRPSNHQNQRRYSMPRRPGSHKASR